MKKRMIAAFIAASMVASLAACGSSKPAETTAASAETTAAAEATGKDASDVKIGIVTDVGGVNDGSFNQSAWAGLSKAADELGFQASYLESHTDADYKPNIETYVDEDYDMIICIGYALADALKDESAANPDMKFAIVDDASLADVPNVTSLMFEQAQASYLVGYVAGKTTKTNTVGIVLGMATDLMNEFGYGYVAGAVDANPDCKVLQNNANSFADTAAGKTAANNMVAQGADVIFHASGASGMGMFQAAEEKGFVAIGVNLNQNEIAPDYIMASMLKKLDSCAYHAITSVVEGTYTGENQVLGLSDGGVDVTTEKSNIQVSDSIKEQLDDLKAKVISGEIEVPYELK